MNVWGSLLYVSLLRGNNATTSLDVLLSNLCRRSLKPRCVSHSKILRYAQSSSSFNQFLMGTDYPIGVEDVEYHNICVAAV